MAKPKQSAGSRNHVARAMRAVTRPKVILDKRRALLSKQVRRESGVSDFWLAARL